MGRKSHRRELDIWINGEHVGIWLIPTRGEAELRYDPAWLSSPFGRPLSMSLPFGVGDVPVRGPAVENYFRNLLPDSDDIRNRMAVKFRLGSAEPFDLLEAVGRDCVGAVQLVAPGDKPEGFDRIDCTPLSDEGVARHLQAVVQSHRSDQQSHQDEFRLCLAGAQEKSGLMLHKDRWCLPHGATPSTHIFKLPMGLVGNTRVNLSTSIENEWLCLQILQAYGLDVAQAEMACFDGQRALVVERFDRRMHSSGNYWLRLPQEDFCQVLAVPPTLKYEEDGGPGFAAIASILRQSRQAEKDLRTFLMAQILNWMLAATDGHAKNYSIQLLPGGFFQLAPIYDVLSGWPLIGRGPAKWQLPKVRLAMAIQAKNRHYRYNDIQRRHFNQMARACGYANGAEPIIQDVLRRTPHVIERMRAELPPGYPEWVSEAILTGLKTSADKLTRMPEG